MRFGALGKSFSKVPDPPGAPFYPVLNRHNIVSADVKPNAHSEGPEALAIETEYTQTIHTGQFIPATCHAML